MPTFLNPAVLIALFAAGVPLIIHFLNIRRQKKQPFSSLLLLEEIERNALKQFKLNQWLLLLLRSLAIFFIVLAFAKPLLPDVMWGAGLKSRPKTSLVIILDNSYSMNKIQLDGTNGFVQAKKAALDILEECTESDEVFLCFTSDMKVRERSFLPGEAKEVISKLIPAPQKKSLAQLLKRSFENLEKARHFHRELYMLSDFQKRSFSQNDTTGFFHLPSSLKHAFFIRTLPDQTQNFAIRDPKIRTQIFEPGKPIQLESTIDFFSGQPKKTQNLKFWLNDKFKQEKTIDNTKSSLVKTRISAKPSEVGFIDGKLELEEDGYDYDNRFHFTVKIPQKIKILVVSSNPSNKLFIESALTSYPNPDFFEISHISANLLRTENLASYEMVVAIGALEPSNHISRKLRNYISKGGGFLWFLSPQESAIKNNSTLKSLNLGQVRSALRIPENQFLQLNEPHWKQPLFQGIWNSEIEARTQWKKAENKVFKALEYKKSFQETLLLGVLNNKPLVTASTLGKGKVMVWATLPTLAHTTFVIHPLFAPFIFQSVFWLASSTQNQVNDFMLGEPIQLRLPEIQTTAEMVEMVMPSGNSFLPKLELKHDGVYLTLPGAELNETGIYSVKIKENQRELSRFAVNYPISESDTSVVNDSVLKKLFKNGDPAVEKITFLTLSNSSELLQQDIQQARSGYDIWKIVLAMGVVLLVIESVLARKVTA